MNNYEEYQKALDSICNRCFGDGPKKVLQELVDKATPKKVLGKWKPDYDPKLYYPDSYHCPSCSRQLRRDRSYKYCPRCGQKLDWSDKDGEI